MVDDADVQDDADDASARLAAEAEGDDLPSGSAGEPPPEALPQAPAVVPAAPVGSVVTPPATPAEAGQGAFAASQEGVAAATDAAQAGLELNNNEKRRLAQVKVDDADIRVQRQLEAQSQLDARNEYIAKKDAADAKVRDFKFHDYFDDPAHGSKALSRFAVFLGGLGNLGGQAPGAPNRALDGLENNIKADHDTQLAYLNSAKYFADKQGEGVQDLLKQQREDRQQAELDYANKKLATADQFAELAQTARGKQSYDAAMIEVAKLKKSGYDDQQKVFSDIAQDNLADARAQLALSKRRRPGGGSARSGDLADFEAAAQAIKPGAPVPREVYALGVKAGFKLKDVQEQVDKARESGKKSLPKGGADGVDPKLILRDIDGTPLVMLSSARAVPKLQEDLRTNTQALKQLQKLADAKQWTSTGPLFHDAVLALAATTSAGKTDTTTAHEKGAITNFLGMPSEVGINDKIEQIKTRISQIKAQGEPLPDDYVDPTSNAPKTAAATAPTPAQNAAMERLARLGVQFGG